MKDGKFLGLELEIGRKRLWDLPGGKVEDGEEPMQTLLREVKEEAGLDVKAEKPNELVLMLTENFFRGYRGKKQDFAAVVKLAGGDQWQTVSLSPDDFKAVEGERVLSSWAEADLLGLRAYCEDGDRLLGSKTWAGSQPALRDLRWTADRGTR